MRNLWIASMVALLAAGLAPVDAHAGKKDKGEKTEKADSAAVELTIEKTGVADLDSFFEKAEAPINNIKNAKAAVEGVRTGLSSALGLPEGTPFADALADLKAKAEGKINVAFEGGKPTLSAQDGVPDNVQAAIDGLNKAFGDAGTAVAALTELPAQMQALAEEGKELPAKVPSMGLKPTELPKTLKITKNNLSTISKAPGEVDALGKSLGALSADVKGAFSGGAQLAE